MQVAIKLNYIDIQTFFEGVHWATEWWVASYDEKDNE